MLPIALALGLAVAEQAGHVQIPVDVYNSMVAAGSTAPRPAPAGYALGNARVTVTVKDAGARFAFGRSFTAAPGRPRCTDLRGFGRLAQR